MEEWFQEVEDHNLANLVSGVSEEVLKELDPPPGLRLWLAQNMLMLVPMLGDEEEDIDNEPKPEVRTMNFSTSTTGPSPPIDLPFHIGDRVQYKTYGSTQKFGVGTLISTEGEGIYTLLTDAGDFIGIVEGMGDELLKVYAG